MQVEKNTKAVFPCPVECLECILPAHFGKERFSLPCVYGPEGYREADPIESCASNLSKVFLRLKCSITIKIKFIDKTCTYDESFIVFFELCQSSIGCISCHRSVK